ncbi:MAG: isoprenylcysteine carboxylmethyltransferase family protein [Bryobacteraceae bacterium]|nr:isoprenylcysteine carboxylmethyltransferase family protein [Bryobacteraceae bacterium]
MIWLRAYLFAGLVAHKVVWELLKRQGAPPAKRQLSTRERLGKLAKQAILIGILVQTLFLDVFPIAEDAWGLRVAGTAIYTLGLLMAISARLQLGSNWSDIEAAQVKQEQAVVANGIYRWVRHPIYAGDLLLLFGLELALNSWLVLGVFVLAPVVLMQAVREEKMLVRNLPGYAEYCSKTWRFVPFVL